MAKKTSKPKIEKVENMMGEVAHSQDKEKSEPGEYEVEDAANTLMRAEHIKKNKKLMPHVHKHLKNKKSAIESIADLREKAQNDGMEKNFPED